MKKALKVHRSRGFTLIELVIVIAVIAILAALLVPTILGQAERARYSRAHGDVSKIGLAIARMRHDTSNTASACLTVLANLSSATSPAACGSVPLCTTLNTGYVCWGGPYQLTTPTDPWNNAYTATEDFDTHAVTVHSNGPDGTSGNADDVTYVQ